ncbi:MAG: Alkane monooxygenase [Deltaproteobacteria bacterium]|nr:Alkane monooxygenase [Deltaproteobacteria bacterium]
MAATTPNTELAAPAVPERATALETLRIWSLHLLCFALPTSTLAFLLTAPHRWWGALPWLGVIVGSVILDQRSAPEHRQPAARLARWPFDAVLYVLAAMQLACVLLAAYTVSAHGFWHIDTLVMFLLVGVNSGYCGIVVAHELIHRREKHRQWLGRVLMGSVLYEHFATEHVRGHHARVGTPEDPATARFGETYQAFFLRTVPGQFKSAWRLECHRIGNAAMPLWDRRQLHNRVLQGLVAEWSVALAIAAVLGAGALAFHLLQSLSAIRLLEAVNYFEHWGLVRSGKKPSPIDSWDTDSRFTLYTLVGLSRHADHHAFATRPYQQLRHWDESPKLPSGYFGMVEMVLLENRAFRRLMTAELERRKLGPFAGTGGYALPQ